MADSGETKIITIFTIGLLLITISMSGCVEDNQQSDKNSDPDNIDKNNFDIDDKDSNISKHDSNITFNESSNNPILTRKTSFIKTTKGNSKIQIEVPEETTPKIEFITDDQSIQSGYAVIILSQKNDIQGVNYCNSLFYWKENNISYYENNSDPINIQLKKGIYDLLILSDFGIWGIIIETSFDGPEYEYKMETTVNVTFNSIEYEYQLENFLLFEQDLSFNNLEFEIDNCGMFFRLFYLSADLDGFGIEKVIVESKLFDPNGEVSHSSGSESKSVYHSETKYTSLWFQTEAFYGKSGRWIGSGNVTIQTIGTPNLENYDVHMYELYINF